MRTFLSAMSGSSKGKGKNNGSSSAVLAENEEEPKRTGKTGNENSGESSSSGQARTGTRGPKPEQTEQERAENAAFLESTKKMAQIDREKQLARSKRPGAKVVGPDGAEHTDSDVDWSLYSDKLSPGDTDFEDDPPAKKTYHAPPVEKGKSKNTQNVGAKKSDQAEGLRRSRRERNPSVGMETRRQGADKNVQSEKSATAQSQADKTIDSQSSSDKTRQKDPALPKIYPIDDSDYDEEEEYHDIDDNHGQGASTVVEKPESVGRRRYTAAEKGKGKPTDASAPRDEDSPMDLVVDQEEVGQSQSAPEPSCSRDHTGHSHGTKVISNNRQPIRSRTIVHPGPSSKPNPEPITAMESYENAQHLFFVRLISQTAPDHLERSEVLDNRGVEVNTRLSNEFGLGVISVPTIDYPHPNPQTITRQGFGMKELLNEIKRIVMGKQFNMEFNYSWELGAAYHHPWKISMRWGQGNTRDLGPGRFIRESWLRTDGDVHMAFGIAQAQAGERWDCILNVYWVRTAFGDALPGQMGIEGEGQSREVSMLDLTGKDAEPDGGKADGTENSGGAKAGDEDAEPSTGKTTKKAKAATKKATGEGSSAGQKRKRNNRDDYGKEGGDDDDNAVAKKVPKGKKSTSVKEAAKKDATTTTKKSEPTKKKPAQKK